MEEKWLTKINDKYKYGSKKRIAGFLASTKSEGDSFTLSEIIEECDIKNHNTSRRLRELRGSAGWEFSHISGDKYLLKKIGWHPNSDECEPKDGDSFNSKDRRFILERDGSKCSICGIEAGEKFRNSSKIAKLDIGHIIPKSKGGTYEYSNLRTECNLCNQSVRDLDIDYLLQEASIFYDSMLPDDKELAKKINNIDLMIDYLTINKIINHHFIF